MKIVCDNCTTKYSIADEKVRGKVFKIRCKKCSHIIVVRGGEGTAQESGQSADTAFPSDPAVAAAEGSGWHLVIDREQVGPLSAGEVRAKFVAGQIDAETYAWKEGFSDWLRLGSIEDFKDLDAGAPAAPSSARQASASVFGDPGNGHGADAGDLFGIDAPAAGGGGGRGGADLFSGGGGLFAGSAPAVARAAVEPMAPALSSASAPEPMAASSSVNAGPQMKGQRNENSVLFSLNNLQALASGGGAAAKSDPRPGYASSQTEGSGLIDIRAMAASTLASTPKEEGFKGAGGLDVPSFSSAPVFTPMAAPILMPTPSAGPPKWMWPVLGVGVVAVIGIVGVGVLLLKKSDPPVVVAALPAPTGTVPVGTVPPSAPAVKSPGVATPTALAPGTAPAAAEAAAPRAEDEQKGSHHHNSHDKGAKAEKGTGTKLAKVDSVAAPPAPAAPAPAKRGGGKKDALDDLLDGAAPDKPTRSSRGEARPSASDENLPEQLDKSAIVGGMSKIKGRVGACYDQFKVPGMANVSVTIVKSGRVQSTSVSGAFAGTPTGDCVARAVKSATFPQFKGAAQTINYPFMLR